MRSIIDSLRGLSAFSRPSVFAFTAFGILSLVALGNSAAGQVPAPPPDLPPTQIPATDAQAPTSQTQPGALAATPNTHTRPEKDPTLGQGPFSIHTVGGEIKEDQLKQIIVGKTLYLRAGYQDNNLEFDEHGRLLGHSPQGSYTLSQIQINKLKLSKHKLELEGDRYALHFLGAAPFEDASTATNRVKITPKKKIVRISFDREQVETPKKKKEKKKHKDQDQTKAETATTDNNTG